MSSVNITLYDLLRNDLHLPEEKAKKFVETIQQTSKEEVAPIVDSVATKHFIKEELQKIELKIEQSKTDTIKWMVGLFIGFFLAIIGLIFTAVKLVNP